jgi:hypothetical protein
MQARPPKNIVLLSDGTGNSGGKGYGTNVWRMYNAIDLNGHITNPAWARQVAYYDDGVGSEDFKLWKLVGGVFGYGLSRNIRDLYAFLIKNYQPGDNIYIFGFSRGAFTARSLAGLISRCGVANVDVELSGEDQRKLLLEQSRIWWLGYLIHCVLRKDVSPKLNRTQIIEALVQGAFLRYRREHVKSRPFLPWPSVLKSIWLRLATFFHSRRKPEADRTVTPSAASNFRSIFSHEGGTIRCVGVWDTVGALGAPFEEVRWLLDRIFRTDFHSRELDDSVEHGLHALAIDDMRLTFHPVLWDEKMRSRGIEQVWFAGAHSNVGGGYPKQGMAHVSLLWMMRKVRALGLRFDDRAINHVADRANVNDKLYEPRSGLGAYYRYRPRDISAYAALLCGGKAKIHASVFHRIASGVEGYAPFNLPAQLEVVDEAGAQTGDAWRTHVRDVVVGSRLAQLKPRVERMVRVRRAIYAAMWVCTILLMVGLVSSSFVLASALYWFWQLPNPAVPQDVVAFVARTQQFADLLIPLSWHGLFELPARLVGDHPFHLPAITCLLALLYVLRSRFEASMQAPFIEFWSQLRVKLNEAPDYVQLPATTTVPAGVFSQRPAETREAS